MSEGKNNIDLADQKVKTLWEGFHLEKSWKSLSLSEQLMIIANLKLAIIQLLNMGKTNEVDALNSEIVMSKIGSRGFSRTRQLDLWFSELREKEYDLQLHDPTKREAMLQQFRDLMKNAVDLKEED
jgi:hypothetical protein